MNHKTNQASEPVEKALIGSLLLQNDLSYKVDVMPYHFKHYTRVAEQLYELLEKKGKADVHTLSAICIQKFIASKEDIMSCVGNANPVEAQTHSETIIELWRNEQEQELRQMAISKLREGETTTEVAEWEAGQREMLLGDVKDAEQERHDKVNAFYDNIVRASEGKYGARLKVGMSEKYDNSLGGGFPVGLHLLAARPEMGKTDFAIQEAVSSAEQGHPTVYFSYEMSYEDLMCIVIQKKTGIHRTRIFQKDQPESILKQIYAALEWFHDLPLFIEDQPYTFRKLMNKIRMYQKTNGIKLVTIDYLQLIMSPSLKAQSENYRVAAISRRFVNLTQELKIPIRALSQLNRAVEDTFDKAPKCHHLRDSGSLEQDARTITFLYRPMVYFKNKEGFNDFRTFVMWGKGRGNLNKDTCFMDYDLEKSTLSDSFCQEYELVEELETFDEIKTPNIGLVTATVKNDDADIPF